MEPHMKHPGRTHYLMSDGEMLQRGFPTKEDYKSTTHSKEVTDVSQMFGLDCEMVSRVITFIEFFYIHLTLCSDLGPHFSIDAHPMGFEFDRVNKAPKRLRIMSSVMN